ncbi:MAG: molybdenum cofactor biosynthesis protein MoaE [Chthoniobacteraceae bacterium]
MNCEVTFVVGPIVVPPCRTPARDAGALVEFHGIVRRMEGAVELSALHYEAYEAMARREFSRIFAELAARHPVHDVMVIHRIGRVPAGEASLYVRVAAKHRGPALSFCGTLIDRMKEDVPIWKLPEPAGA